MMRWTHRCAPVPGGGSVAPGVAQTGAAVRDSAQPCISEQSGNAGPVGSWAEYAARNAPAMIA